MHFGSPAAAVTKTLVLLSALATVGVVPPPAAAQDAGASSSRPLAPDYRIDADGSVTLRLCYNWSCAARQRLSFTASDMKEVARQMALCPGDGLHDRVQRMRIGIWQMEVLAQKYQPFLANDEAINEQEWGQDGRMDCIDNASNTTTFLHALHDLGLLPGWSMGKPRVRARFSPVVHWTAAVVDASDARSWAVDSWFRPNGHLPFVMPLEDWASGRIAWEPPFTAWNPYPRYSNQLCGA